MQRANRTLKNAPAIQAVDSLRDLFAHQFDPAINAYCYRRTLTPNFNSLAHGLMANLTERFEHHPIADFSYDEVEDLGMSLTNPDDKAALRVITGDIGAVIKLHRPGHVRIRMRIVHPWAVDNPTTGELEKFHTDGTESDAYFDHTLCCYNGPTTEYIDSEDALNTVNASGVYETKPNATIKQFGVGNMWRIATMNKDALTKPFIHRAPRIIAPASPRLLLLIASAPRPHWGGYPV